MLSTLLATVSVVVVTLVPLPHGGLGFGAHLGACSGVIYKDKCVIPAQTQSNGGISGTGSATFKSNLTIMRQITNAPGEKSEEKDLGAGHSDSTSEPDPCDYRVAADQSLYTRVTAGRTTDDGFVVTPYCPQALSLEDRRYTQVQAEEPIFIDYGDPAPAAPPPPDPENLAEDATALLPVPKPDLKLGPDPEGAVVNRPMWLWVDEPGDLTSTVALLGVEVTATATLTQTTWQLGEPVAKPGSGSNAQATVVCDGPGSPPPSPDELNRTPAADWDPTCGHTFQWRSSPERTGGTGAWPVTATAQWTVTWTSNVGVNGSTALETTNATTIEVLELKTRLVDNPDAPLPGG